MKRRKESHEWIRIDKNIAAVGLTAYARGEIGEIVNVELPKVGQVVKAQDEVCIIESTKSAIDIYSPVSGKIVEINRRLEDNISLINKSPEKEGWLFKVEVMDLTELKGLK